MGWRGGIVLARRRVVGKGQDAWVLVHHTEDLSPEEVESHPRFLSKSDGHRCSELKIILADGLEHRLQTQGPWAE